MRVTLEVWRQKNREDKGGFVKFDVDDVNLDFAILDENEEANEMDVVLVAAKRDRIDEFMAVIEEAGRDRRGGR